ETKLKEASQSRFVLEIGLIKLIEMRRVQPIEAILNRLASLEKSAGTLLQAADPVKEESKAAVVFSEKKTLILDVPLESTSVFEAGVESGEAETQSDEPPANERKIDYSSITSIPVRLSPISSEELEHIENPWLDTAY